MRWDSLRKKRGALMLTAWLLCMALLTELAVFMAGMRQETAAKPLTWVDFQVTAQAMSDALAYDVASQETDCPMDWIDLLAYAGARCGGDFSDYARKQKPQMDALVKRLRAGESLEELTAGLQYFGYYRTAYDAVLGGLVGEYSMRSAKDDGTSAWETRYGLKGYAPIAEGWAFSHSDDFCAARDFGFRRRHLGHDLFGTVGTPVVNVETCVVQVVGWNRYGGWRIGMRSLDGRRYYYYAHLRSDHPYAAGLTEGQLVYAGEVIGYMGMTGYSDKEGFNGMQRPHLHFGIQLIFDESSKQEIWIDTYELVKFLNRHRSTVTAENGEYHRVYPYYEGVE